TCTKKVNNCSTYLADGTCNTCNSSYQLTDSKACKSPTKTYGGQTAYLVGDYYVFEDTSKYAGWQDASDYCENLGMRLPTLAETQELYNHNGETGAPTRQATWTSSDSNGCPALRNFGPRYCVQGGGCVDPGGEDRQCDLTNEQPVACVAKEE
ncbi:hypothetical protein IJ732_04640, partial [bacterium]|nr:hypothetical protein [bacterium]